jgi:hypothetical protein
LASRKLNLKQLVTLSEVYWDDPAKLAEILADLRERIEPEAEALSRSVAGRITTLKTNPAAVAKPAAADVEAPPEEVAAAPTSSTKRRYVAALAVGLVAAVLAWVLWLRGDDQDASPQTQPGIEIAEHGDPPPDAEPPHGQAASPPRGAMRPAERPQPAGGGDRGRLSGEVRAPRAIHEQSEREIAEPADAADAPEREIGDAADTADRKSAARAAGRAAAARTTPKPVRAKSAAPAADGVAIDEARLVCYRTDSRPEQCGDGSLAAPSSGSAAKPAPARQGGAVTIVLPSAASSSAPPADAMPAAAETGGTGAAAAPAGERRRSTARTQTGVSTSPAGGSDQAGAAPAAAARRAPVERSAAPSADAPAQQPVAATAAAAPPAPQCPAVPPSGRAVFILDGSVSMGLPLDVDAEREDELDDGIRNHDPEARRAYRALLAEAGPKRITRAQEAFAAAAGDLPAPLELGLVVFQECRDIRQVGVFDARQRRSAIDYVRALVPKGRTPLAESLRSAARMLGDGRSSIVLLTDGREFCGGDPCAAAAEIAASHPGTAINIVDITGQAKAECVADLTGGRSYKPEASDDLGRVLRNAFRGADPQCGMETARGETTVP